MRILITDEEQRAALAATRALGREGHNILVTGSGTATLSSASRYCSRAFHVPDPNFVPAAYAEKILKIARNEGIDVILPVTEPSIRSLNPARATLPEDCLLACPDAETFDAVSDKFNLFRLAERLQIDIPRTLFIADGARIADQGIDSMDFPVVVKPMASRIVTEQGMLHGKVLYAESLHALKDIYRTKIFLEFPSLIQERITGSGTGLFTLFDRDRHLALFSHCRVREKPPSGGVSVVCKSSPLDPEMVLSAQALLSEVGWTGVAMVEFKRDQRDGRAKLMEINGRLWGSLQLAISSGINFPCLLIDYLLGNKPPAMLDRYTLGYKLKWLPGIMDHLLIRLRRSRQDLHLPPGHEPLWRAFLDSLRAFEKNTSYDSLCRDDPKPFLHEMKIYCRTALGKT